MSSTDNAPPAHGFAGPFREIIVHGARLAPVSRRGFLGVGGALVVALGITPQLTRAAARTGALEATKPMNWIEIHADSTVTLRTGKCDFGQSTIYTAIPQVVAEELSIPVSAITRVISGDTDRTPDGGGTFAILRFGAENHQKVAAYTREAVLELAAKRFGVPRAQVSVKDGVISGGGRQATYGEIVAGQDLQLTIPVKGDVSSIMGVVIAGDPPLKKRADYTVIGKPVMNPIVRPKVSGKTVWVDDVKLPGMLHARTIHPATLGSTLVEAGTFDTGQFPGSKLVRIGNLLAVVSPDEWEAVQAAQAVAASTKWSEWSGLPGSEKLRDHMTGKADWSGVKPTRSRASKGDVAAVKGAKVHSASYFMPYMKHAPIMPTVTLAAVKADGSVTVHTHTQHPTALRQSIALMLGKDVESVVVRTYPGAGHFGRSNGGNAGSEDEAVLLSRELGVPVRLQWTRAEDMQWSTQSTPMVSDIHITLDEAGRIAAYEATHSSPPWQDDRLTGALLAGLPTIPPPNAPDHLPIYGPEINISDAWIYGAVPAVSETGRGTVQLGQRESATKVGLRGHSMRTPVQFQQNFPREMAMSEAAAAAGKDPLQFRIDSTADPRVKAVLERLRTEAVWQARPSPAPGARPTGNKPLRGRGVSLMLRDGGYWGCSAEIAVTPSTGAIKVERVTLVIDVGIVINPLQLKRQAQAGCLMGVGQALHEEMAFDTGAVTSVDWLSYPILTMAEMPEIKIVLAPFANATTYAQGSESANALAAPAIAGAFLDATGKPARRLPLRPEYVMAMLKA